MNIGLLIEMEIVICSLGEKISSKYIFNIDFLGYNDSL